MEKIKANFISEKITSNTSEAKNLFDTKRFGEKKENKIFYSLSEAIFLVQNRKMDIIDSKDKLITKEEILKKFQKLDKKINLKSIVFNDLRKKGHIVKTALKFGADFRVYEKGKKVEKSHSKWLVFTASESQRLTWQDFSAKTRIAHSTKKNLLIAIVDEENSISYYEIIWMKIK
jgi:tRNA-intron endonuclease